jgi:hypothetical protein
MHADAVAADESATLGQVNTSLGGYVTLGTAQTITAQKTFTTSGSSDTMIISHGSGSGFALDVIKAGNGEAIRVQKTSGSGNAMTISGGNFEAPTIVRTGGTSSQFLKADGSVDSSTYLTTSIASLTYVTIATPTTITGVKTFSGNTLQLQADGTSQATIFRNSSGQQTNTVGSNSFGFNNSNNIYFNKGSLTNAGILVFNNTAARAYTLPDLSGTIALTTDLGAYLPLTGGTLTGALNGTSALFTGDVATATRVATDTINGYTGGSIPLTIQTGGAQSVILGTNGTPRLTLASTGAATFSSSVTAGGTIRMSNAVVNRAVIIGVDSAFEPSIQAVVNNSDVPRQLSINPLGGNVGIGTASPASRLHTIGGNMILGLDWATSNFDSNTARELRVSSNGNNSGYITQAAYHSASTSATTFFRSYVNAASSGSLVFESGTGNFLTNSGIPTSYTERMRITSDGFARLSASSGGIQFNGDTAAANALDDYEEGTWTPVISDGTNDATMIAGNGGTYTKIGRQVTLTGYVRTTSIGSVTGDIRIKNLPFTVGGSTIGGTSQTFGFYVSMNLLLGSSVSGQVEGGQNFISLYVNDLTSGVSTMQASEWGNNGFVFLNFSYIV